MEQRSTEINSLKIKIGLFSALLITIILLVILYASGLLKFGLNPQFTYILYAMSGLLAAVTCYGLLSSFGELIGERNGFNLQLGGAIVAFVVVAGGGALYEKYFHTPEYFDMRVIFYQTNINRSENVTGTITLFIGSTEKVAQLNNSSNVLFQQIPISFKYRPIKIDLKGNFEIDTVSKLPLIDDNSIYIKVKSVNPYIAPEDAELLIDFIEGRKIVFAPKPDKMNVVLKFSILSRSQKLLPLAREVLIEVFNNNGSVAYSEKYNLENSLIVLPNTSEDIVLDLLIPKNVLRRLDNSSSSVTFFYDNQIQKRAKSFSQEFNFEIKNYD